MAPRGEGVAWNVLDLDLTTEPTVTWTTAVELSDDTISLDLLGESGGVVVVALNRSVRIEGEPPPSTPMLGLDAATGAVRLRIEDDDQTCQLGAEAVTCVTDGSTRDAAVVTYPTDGGESVAADHPGAMSALLLDDGGMLVMEGGTTALADLVRLDSSGAELWRSQLAISGMADASYLPIEVTAGTVQTWGGTVDLASGGDPTTFPPLETAVDGATRTLLHDGTTQLVAADGSEVIIPPGEMWLSTDDAFGGAVSLREEPAGSVVAYWDGGTRTHAPSEGGSCFTSIRLDGVLVQYCDDAPDLVNLRLVAIDQATAEQLWERPDSWGQTLATSDTLVLATNGEAEGIDRRTGETRWSIQVPDGFVRLAVVDGGILAFTTDVVMRLDADPSP